LLRDRCVDGWVFDNLSTGFLEKHWTLAGARIVIEEMKGVKLTLTGGVEVEEGWSQKLLDISKTQQQTGSKGTSQKRHERGVYHFRVKG